MLKEADYKSLKETLAEVEKSLNRTKENMAVIKHFLKGMKKEISRIDDKKVRAKELKRYKKHLEEWKDTVASYYNLKVVEKKLREIMLEQMRVNFA